MASLSPVKLGTIISLGFIPVLLSRIFLVDRFVLKAERITQPRRAFLLEFFLCFSAALLINTYNYFFLAFPLFSLGSLVIGCVIAGFFIGLDSSLVQERQIIQEAMHTDTNSSIPERLFPMTRKFTFIAITTLIFVSLVLIMIFTRDIDWLAQTAQDPGSIAQAKTSVMYEIFFVMGILIVLIVNLIFSYSKNLKLLFDNETRILENVSKGDLSSKVPIATQDEFGLIAGHTNHMIEGLRHRFELINSLKLAEEVQQNLLPKHSPYLEKYDVSGTSIYCDQTGGDYYDYFLLPDDKMGIVVADACGHGIGAAMLMTSVRAFLISAMESYSAPGDMLVRINQHITKDCSAGSRFTSLFFLEINQPGASLKWVRAGHEPALYYHARTDRFSKLAGDGLVLGIDHSYEYEEQEINNMEQGDIILIGTDGINETRNRDDLLFGHSSIEQVIRDNRDNSASIIKQQLIKAVQSYRHPLPQEDDLTLVVIKKR